MESKFSIQIWFQIHSAAWVLPSNHCLVTLAGSMVLAAQEGSSGVSPAAAHPIPLGCSSHNPCRLVKPPLAF